MGEKLDPTRHFPRVDVKTVTLHRFHLERTPHGWEALVIWIYKTSSRKLSMYRLIINSGLGFDSFLVSVFHFLDFADGICHLNYLWMGITPRQNEVHKGRFAMNDF